MNYLSIKYILLIGSRFRNFRKKSESLYNFSCPFCGDSKRHPKKARGYLFEREGTFFYKCHKCQRPVVNFDTFLKDQDSLLFGEYLREKLFKPKPKVKEIYIDTPVFYDYGALKDLFTMDTIPFSDPMKKYVIDRQIPEECYNRLYHCQEFKKFTNSLVPNKFDSKSLYYEEARLLIPYFTENKKMFGFSGRAIVPDAFVRYINIILDESQPKLYGMDIWDKTKPSLVVEGPIDSLFLDNCLATCGNDMVSSLYGFDKRQFTIIYDNEPRSPHTKRKLLKAIRNGYKVCIWPKTMLEKDINSMILAGYSKEEIHKTISENSFEGLHAELRMIL